MTWVIWRQYRIQAAIAAAALAVFAAVAAHNQAGQPAVTVMIDLG